MKDGDVISIVGSIVLDIKDGLLIGFDTIQRVKPGYYYEIEFKGISYPFKMRKSSIVERGGNQVIEVECSESGYWARRLSKKENLDIMDLHRLEVKVIIDEERIAELKKQELYC